MFSEKCLLCDEPLYCNEVNRTYNCPRCGDFFLQFLMAGGWTVLVNLHFGGVSFHLGERFGKIFTTNEIFRGGQYFIPLSAFLASDSWDRSFFEKLIKLQTFS